MTFLATEVFVGFTATCTEPFGQVALRDPQGALIHTFRPDEIDEWGYFDFRSQYWDYQYCYDETEHALRLYSLTPNDTPNYEDEHIIPVRILPMYDHHTVAALGIAVGCHPRFSDLLDRKSEKGECMLDIELEVRDLGLELERKYGDNWRDETRDFIVDIDEEANVYISTGVGGTRRENLVDTWRQEIKEAKTGLPFREWFEGRSPQTPQTPHDPWSEHPRFPVSNWRDEVAEDDTRLGYWDWVKDLLEREEAS